MKKLLSIFFISIICLIGFNVLTYASEFKVLSNEEFVQLQEEEIIDDNISYDLWLKFIENNNKLEQELNLSGNFKSIYNGELHKLSTINLESGDVIITNATSSFGLTGHAAIAIDSDEILDIPGPKKSVRTQTVNQFKNEYKNGWIKVYRPKDSSWGTKAAKWATETYKGSNAIYKITLDTNSTDKTYCSKIVHQAYKFGVGESAFKTYYHDQGGFTANDYNIDKVIISPYNLPISLDINYNNKL